MSDRPTPLELARRAEDPHVCCDECWQAFGWASRDLLDLLAEHGYVIVHPDDVDSADPWAAHHAIFAAESADRRSDR